MMRTLVVLQVELLRINTVIRAVSSQLVST
jgi:hypothetical protein